MQIQNGVTVMSTCSHRKPHSLRPPSPSLRPSGQPDSTVLIRMLVFHLFNVIRFVCVLLGAVPLRHQARIWLRMVHQQALASVAAAVIPTAPNTQQSQPHHNVNRSATIVSAPRPPSSPTTKKPKVTTITIGAVHNDDAAHVEQHHEPYTDHVVSEAVR